MPDAIETQEADRGDQDHLGMERLRRDPWTGGALRHGLPRVPTRDALPPASVELLGCVVRVGGTNSKTYICEDVAGTPTWVAVT